MGIGGRRCPQAGWRRAQVNGGHAWRVTVVGPATMALRGCGGKPIAQRSTIQNLPSPVYAAYLTTSR